jgi:hypothetical protein
LMIEHPFHQFQIFNNQHSTNNVQVVALQLPDESLHLGCCSNVWR